MGLWYPEVSQDDALANQIVTIPGCIILDSDTTGAPGTGLTLGMTILEKQFGPSLRVSGYGAYLERVDTMTTAIANSPTQANKVIDVWVETAAGTFTKVTAGISPSIVVKSASITGTNPPLVSTYITAANYKKIIPNGRIFVTPTTTTSDGGAASITFSVVLWLNRAAAARVSR